MFKKFVLAVLIVYGRNVDQIITLSLILVLQIVWLAYVTKYTPLKYRFANITLWINEFSIAVLVCMTLLHNSSVLKRNLFYVVLEVILHFPLGAILITLIFIVYIILVTDLRELYFTIIPYKPKIKMEYVSIKLHKHFGEFPKYNKAASKNITVKDASTSTSAFSKSSQPHTLSISS